MSKDEIFLSVLPSLILVIIASVHVFRWSHDKSLSAWRGGGFGMYSEISDKQGRVLKAYGFSEHWEPISLLEDDLIASKIQLYPNETGMRRLIHRIGCHERYKYLDKYKLVKLEYWHMIFDGEKAKVSMQKKSEYVKKDCKEN